MKIGFFISKIFAFLKSFSKLRQLFGISKSKNRTRIELDLNSDSNPEVLIDITYQEPVDTHKEVNHE